MLQINPDWHQSYTVAEFEREFPEFKFFGTGCYLTNTDTVLVLAEAGPDQQIWSKCWPKDQIFEVFIWNCEVADTILAYTLPTKADNRS